MGELVIGGSEYDPLSRMVSKHCIFYLFVLVFVALGVHASLIN